MRPRSQSPGPARSPAAAACLKYRASESSRPETRLRVLLSDIVDRANVRVIESRGRLCLGLKSFERVAVVRQPVREEFQRNEAVKARVFGLVHHTHPSAAELLNNVVVRNCAANQRPSVWHRRLYLVVYI